MELEWKLYLPSATDDTATKHRLDVRRIYEWPVSLALQLFLEGGTDCPDPAGEVAGKQAPGGLG